MCARYYMELSPELRPIIERAKNSSLAAKMVHKLGKPVKTEGEIRPTDIAPVIAPDQRGVRSVFPMIWGFTLPDKENTKRSQPLINARMESADRKVTFRDSWSRRRCIVPASYYFEWDHFTSAQVGSPSSETSYFLSPYDEKRAVLTSSRKRTGRKYAIQPRNETVTWLAGLYRIENGYPHFTVLTREPEGELKNIHDRMPVILDQGSIDEWVNPLTDLIRVKEIAWDSITEMAIEACN